MNQVGRDIPRLEVRAKVTGRADYTHHLRLPGMLHGKVFRSTVPHGRIRSIDTEAAKALPGVYRVITGEDIKKLIPEPYYGRRSTISRSWRSTKCAMSASRWQWCWRRSACRRDRRCN